MTGLSNLEREAVVMVLDDQGHNKCFDCCLVVDCPECGPCTQHTPEQEASDPDVQAALALARRM